MTTLFYLFSNVFHIYATCQFSNVFLQKKKESAKSDVVLFTLYYIINSCAYLLFGNWIINLLSNFVPYCLIAIYHKNKFIYSIGSSFILCAVLIVLDTLVVAIQSVLNIHSIFFEQGFVSNIVMVAFVNIVSHSFFKKNQLNVYNVPLVKTQMKKIIVTAKTLYSHPKNVSKIYAALHTDLAW